MSKRQFTRRFKDETGLTPAKAVERIRLETARDFVTSSSWTIDTIARETGYADTERMRRSFVRAFGHPPQVLRRQRKPEHGHRLSATGRYRISRCNIMARKEGTASLRARPSSIECSSGGTCSGKPNRRRLVNSGSHACPPAALRNRPAARVMSPGWNRPCVPHGRVPSPIVLPLARSVGMCRHAVPTLRMTRMKTARSGADDRCAARGGGRPGRWPRRRLSSALCRATRGSR